MRVTPLLHGVHMDNDQPPLPFGEHPDPKINRVGPRPDGPDGPAPRDTRQGWRLDDHTRSIGRQGVAAARALLQGPGRAA